MENLVTTNSLINSALNFIKDADKEKIDISSMSWRNIYYTNVLIPYDQCILQTSFIADDLLSETYVDHWINDFEPLIAVEHESSKYDYKGMTIIHDSADDAQDFANYLKSKIN